MARAVEHSTTKLSSLIRDPFVRAALVAAERDGLEPVTALVETQPCLQGGAAAVPDLETEPA
jgi:hypothetical protein